MKTNLILIALLLTVATGTSCKENILTDNTKTGNVLQEEKENKNTLTDTLIGKWILMKITHNMTGKDIYATDAKGMATMRILSLNTEQTYVYEYESNETDFVSKSTFVIKNNTKYRGRFILFSDKSEDCELKFYSNEAGELFMTIDDRHLDGGMKHYKKISELPNE